MPDEEIKDDLQPMKRAVAFSRSIKDSKRIVDLFTQIINQYIKTNPNDENLLHCELDHVDGTQNSLERTSKLEWLKADTFLNPSMSGGMGSNNICRILSNARCLSEGVDVPALDAVIFLTPRNSVVDVVQSVGRVMRKAEGKKYGYIILPVGIPADIPPEVALKDNQKYKVIWQVLQALRAHDDRFNATVNKIDLNHKRPPQINIIGVGGGDTGEGGNGTPPLSRAAGGDQNQLELNLIGSSYYIDGRRLACQCRIFGPITIDVSEHIEAESVAHARPRGIASNQMTQSHAVVRTLILDEADSEKSSN